MNTNNTLYLVGIVTVMALATLKPIETRSDSLGFLINEVTKKYSLDANVIKAILMVESRMNPRAISKTGDYGIAQVNYRVWKKELKRVYGFKLNRQNLFNSEYSLNVMGMIFKQFQARKTTDKTYYSLYHSKTKKFRLAYERKLKKTGLLALGGN